MAAAARDDASAPAPACRNCGAPAGEAFCPRCGQETATRLPTARQFLKEAAGRYVALDGRLWRTLAMLLLRPGFLTREYFAGRRRRYVRPSRLFLVLSIAMFATIRFAIGVPELGEAIEVSGSGPPAAPRSGNGVGVEPKAAAAGPLVRVEASVDAARVLLPGMSLTLDEQGDLAVEGSGPIVEALAQRIRRFNALPRQERVEQAVLGTLRHGPYAMIVLLPAFALLLLLVYAGRHRRHPQRPRRYAEHLVFAAHNHAFFFAAVMLAVAVSWRALTALLWLWAIVYLLLAMKSVYGGGWAGVLARAWLLAVAYFVLFVVVTAGLIVAAIVVR